MVRAGQGGPVGDDDTVAWSSGGGGGAWRSAVAADRMIELTSCASRS